MKKRSLPDLLLAAGVVTAAAGVMLLILHFVYDARNMLLFQGAMLCAIAANCCSFIRARLTAR